MNPLNSAEARNRGELSDGGERVSQDAGKIAKAGSAIETRTKADMSILDTVLHLQCRH